jgi:hypothetical protein
MRRLFAAAILSLTILPAAPAAAGDTCASIAGGLRGCAPLPALSVGPDLHVEVKTRSRTLDFAGTAKDEFPCPESKCRCQEHVEHFDFKGPVPGFRAVNEAEFRAADGMRCSAENVSVTRFAERFAVTKRSVSTAISEVEYCRGCGGSCHGRTRLSAHDAKTGVRLTLADAVEPNRIEALKDRLIEDFLAANPGVGDRAALRTNLAGDLARRNLAEDGLYVEDASVFLNLDTFAPGCAEGSFHPVAIPRTFLKPDFLARLN